MPRKIELGWMAGRKIFLGAGGLAVFLLTVGAMLIRAQSPSAEQPPAFAVATVKPSAPGNEGARAMFTPDGISYEAVPMQLLLEQAFGVEQDRTLDIPVWAKEARFDVQAKVDVADGPKLERTPAVQRRAMLLPLLEEHFNLKFHHETKTLAVYELVIAEKGAKLTKSKPEDAGVDEAHSLRNMDFDPNGHIDAQKISLDVLAHALTQGLGRTVIDHTGLVGNYDFTLKWTPEEKSAGGGNDADGPSLFTALKEQLGLKLVSAKLPVDAIVIDHIEGPGKN